MFDFCDSSFMFITVFNATLQCDPCREIKYVKLGTAEGLVMDSFTIWLPA